MAEKRRVVAAGATGWSGTARELAARLGRIRSAALGVPLEQLRGPREARRATLTGVHRGLDTVMKD